MKTKSTISLLVLTLAFFMGCSQENSPVMPGDAGTEIGQYLGNFCGSQTEVTLFAGQTINAGTVTVENNETTLAITIQTTGDWYMKETHVAISVSLAGIPQTKTGNPQPGKFPYKHTFGTYPNSVQYDTYEFSLASLGYQPGALLYIAVHAALEQVTGGTIVQTQTGWGNGNQFPGANWAMWFNYTIQACTNPPDSIEVGDFTTYTQGGYGSPSNSGPGSYRDLHFASAFPNGLKVGDLSAIPTGWWAYYATSTNVMYGLPTGGTAGPLNGNYDYSTLAAELNGTSDPGGVLLGQVIALTLSVQFDLTDPNFGASAINLKDLVVAPSTSVFQGLTVQDLLDLGNEMLAGFSVSYSASQINEAITAINENFDNGTYVGGFLALP